MAVQIDKVGKLKLLVIFFTMMFMVLFLFYVPSFYNGGNYTVHIGPRGGKYIKCNGKKKYLDLPKTKQIPKMSI